MPLVSAVSGCLQVSRHLYPACLLEFVNFVFFKKKDKVLQRYNLLNNYTISCCLPLCTYGAPMF